MLKAVLFCAVDADWWVPYIFCLNFPRLIWRLSARLIVVIASDWGVWTCRICFASATESAQNHGPRTRRPRGAQTIGPLCPCWGAESRDSDAPILAASWGHALQIPGHDSTVKSHSDSATAQLAVVLIRRRQAPKWGTWPRWASFSTSKSFRWSWCFGEKDGKFSQWLCCISMHEFNRF